MAVTPRKMTNPISVGKLMFELQTAVAALQAVTTAMSTAELAVLDGVTAGTAAASKALVNDSAGAIDTIKTPLLVLDAGTKTATATAGAATLAKTSGKITTEALTTAQDALYTLTLTNSKIAAADIVLASVAFGTNTQGTTVIKSVTPAAGSVVIVVANNHATAQSLNGTLVISFAVIKA